MAEHEFVIEKSYRHRLPVFKWPEMSFDLNRKHVTIEIYTPEVLPEEFYVSLGELVSKYLPKNEHSHDS